MIIAEILNLELIFWVQKMDISGHKRVNKMLKSSQVMMHIIESYYFE